MSDKRRSYTTLEVAKRLGVSLPTVQRWVDSGRLLAWKTPGGHRRIDAYSAELFFAAQERVAVTSKDLSAQRVSEVSEVSEILETSTTSKMTILIVDDDPIDRVLMENLVRKTMPQAIIVIAENGFQGLLIAGRMGPDVVVTDLQMPHMNGFEMIRQLLVDSTNRPAAVFAVSAHLQEHMEYVGELPIEVKLFSKPIDEKTFAAALKGTVGRWA